MLIGRTLRKPHGRPKNRSENSIKEGAVRMKTGRNWLQIVPNGEICISGV
jgi:hypothetical protein